MPELHPKEVMLREASRMEIWSGDQRVGEMVMPSGAVVRVTQVLDNRLVVDGKGARAAIPVQKTDFVERSLAARRARLKEASRELRMAWLAQRPLGAAGQRTVVDAPAVAQTALKRGGMLGGWAGAEAETDFVMLDMRERGWRGGLGESAESCAVFAGLGGLPNTRTEGRWAGWTNRIGELGAELGERASVWILASSEVDLKDWDIAGRAWEPASAVIRKASPQARVLVGSFPVTSLGAEAALKVWKQGGAGWLAGIACEGRGATLNGLSAFAGALKQGGRDPALWLVWAADEPIDGAMLVQQVVVARAAGFNGFVIPNGAWVGESGPMTAQLREWLARLTVKERSFAKDAMLWVGDVSEGSASRGELVFVPFDRSGTAEFSVADAATAVSARGDSILVTGGKIRVGPLPVWVKR